MFLVFFLIFILLFTVFENILLASFFLLLVMLSMSVYQRTSKKKILSKKMLIAILGSFLLAGIVFGIKERRYYVPAPTLNAGMRDGRENIANAKIIWTGNISDISAQ